MTNLTERFWPQWSRKNQIFLNEDEIVTDLIIKIRGSRTAMCWWCHADKDDVSRYYNSNKNKIANYYLLSSPLNPYFQNRSESLHVIQLGILTKVWEFLNQEVIEYDRRQHLESSED